MSCVHFTKLLVWLWKGSSEFESWRVQRIERLFLWANFIPRPASDLSSQNQKFQAHQTWFHDRSAIFLAQNTPPMSHKYLLRLCQSTTTSDHTYPHDYTKHTPSRWIFLHPLKQPESWNNRIYGSFDHKMEGTGFMKLWTCSVQVFEEMAVNRF